MKENYFDNRIFYKINDFKPGRHTLVFIHGVSGSSSAWIPYEKLFENKYNVLTYDIRGHGNSKKYPNYEDYAIKNFANDLHELLAHLGISKFVLISNSFGAQVAIEYIKLWRDTVIGIVFTSPEVYVADTFLASLGRPCLTLLNIILAILSFDPKPRGQVDYAKHINSTDWDIKRNLADMTNTTLRVHFAALRQSFNKVSEYAFDKIHVPTLIIHGEKDSMVPMKSAERVKQEVQGSTLVTIPNIDHNTVHNGVTPMSQAIASFVDGIPL